MREVVRLALDDEGDHALAIGGDDTDGRRSATPLKRHYVGHSCEMRSPPFRDASGRIACKLGGSVVCSRASSSAVGPGLAAREADALPTELRPRWRFGGFLPLCVRNHPGWPGAILRAAAGAEEQSAQHPQTDLVDHDAHPTQSTAMPTRPSCTAMPAGAAPGGNEVGEPADSLRLPSSTASVATASALLSTTNSQWPSGLRRSSTAPSPVPLRAVEPPSVRLPSRRSSSWRRNPMQC